MATIADALVRLGLDPRDFKRGLADAERMLGDLGKKMNSVGKSLSTKVTLPLAGIAAAALRASGRMEQMVVGMTALTGSGERANQMLKELREFAAKTPFQFPGLVSGAKNMLAYGFAAEEVVPTLRILGDTVAAIGGGEVEIQRVIRALGQMQAKGKVVQQEVNQIAELGIPIKRILAEGLNVSTAELEKLQEKGIEASTAIDIILRGLADQFGGLAEKQAGTLVGLFSTARDEVTRALTEIGNDIVETFELKKLLEDFTRSVDSVIARWKGLSKETKDLVFNLAAFAAAAGPVILLLGQLTIVLRGLATALLFVVSHPIIAGIAALAAGIGVLVAQSTSASKEVDSLKRNIEGLEGIEFGTDAIGKPTAKQKPFVGQFRDIFEKERKGIQDAVSGFFDELESPKNIQEFQQDVRSFFNELKTGGKAIVPTLDELERMDAAFMQIGKSIESTIGPDITAKIKEAIKSVSDESNNARSITELFSRAQSDAEVALESVNAEISVYEQSLKKLQDETGKSISELEKVSPALATLVKGYREARSEADIFEDTIRKQNEQLQQQEQEMARAHLPIENLKEQLRTLKEQMSTFVVDFQTQIVSAFRPIGVELGQLFAGIFNQISVGLGNTLAQILVFNAKGKEAFKAFGKSIAASAIGALVAIIVKTILWFTIGRALLSARAKSEYAVATGLLALWAAVAAVKEQGLVGIALIPVYAAAAVGAGLLAAGFGAGLGAAAGSGTAQTGGNPDVAAAQHGGIVTRPTLTVMGEHNRPEMITPLSSPRARRMGGGAITINAILDGRLLAEAMIDNVPGVYEFHIGGAA